MLYNNILSQRLILRYTTFYSYKFYFDLNYLCIFKWNSYFFRKDKVNSFEHGHQCHLQSLLHVFKTNRMEKQGFILIWQSDRKTLKVEFKKQISSSTRSFCNHCTFIESNQRNRWATLARITGKSDIGIAKIILS